MAKKKGRVSSNNNVIGVEGKKDWKAILKKAEQSFKVLSKKAQRVAKELEKGAAIGAQISKLKVEEMTLEAKKDKLLKELGKKVMQKTKEFTDKDMKTLATQIQGLEKVIQDKEKKVKELRRRFKNK